MFGPKADATRLALGLHRHDGHAVASSGHAADHDLAQCLVALAFQHAGLHRIGETTAHIDRSCHGLGLSGFAFADSVVLLELCDCAGVAASIEAVEAYDGTQALTALAREQW